MATTPTYHLILFLLSFLLVTSPSATFRRHGDSAGDGVRFSPENKPTCVYGNVTFVRGQRFQPDPCTYCHCPRRGGRPRCAIQDCYREPSCVSYHKPDDECCGVCVQFGCLHSDGRSYPPGAIVRTSACETCRCPESGGRTLCERIKCQPVPCVDAIRREGACCPECPHGANCLLGTRVIKAGVMVKVSRCKTCFCPRPTAGKSWDHQPRAVCSLNGCK